MTVLQLSSFVRPDLAAEVIRRGGRMDLHSACALGATEYVSKLANPEALQPINGFYPLQFALTRPESVEILLRSGDDPVRSLSKVGWFDWEEHAASAGVTAWQPLHMVALGRGNAPHTSVAQLLLDAGADVLALAAPCGETPLHLAAIFGRCELIAWLVGAGCPVDVRTAALPDEPVVHQLFPTEPFGAFWHTASKTPLMLAAGEGHGAAVHTLLELDANVQAVDSGGFSPLHYAAGAFWREDVEIARHLLEAGAPLELRSAAGQTAREVAEQRGYREVVGLLC